MCHYRRGYACLQLAGEPHRSLCPQAEGIALMDHARIIVRYMKTIGPVLTFVHLKSAVMQSLGGSQQL